jgi:uncharacterized membrane protein
MMNETGKQSQTQSDEERGYASQQPPDYYRGNDTPGGYPPLEYRPLNMNPFYYDFREAQHQQYWSQQPYGAPGDVSPFEMTSTGMRARTAGLLCYLFVWVGGLVFLLLERQNRFVRFHAAQSLFFFGTMSILGWVCSLFPFALFGLGGVVGLVGFIAWIVLMVAAHRGRYYKLPLFGDLAEQLANRFVL